MKSMVVLFSVMALVAAKPSLPVAFSYAAPAVALAPAAVSHQSRIDIKSSPAVVKTEFAAPAVARTFVAEPAYLSAPLAYAAPVAAAVSSQSRIDIKSSPAVVKTEFIAPAVERTYVAKPPIASAPWAFAAPIAAVPAAVSTLSRFDIKSSPALLKTEIIAPAVERTYVAKPPIASAPLAYAAPIAAAPAAVSTQSRLDIKSSPAVVSAISASPFAYNAPLAFGAPLTYSAPLTKSYTSSIFAPANAPVIAPALLKTAAISPVAVSAPAKIESIEPALPVAPTDTPEVAAARAAHLEAKRLEELHQIQKRSVGIVAASPVVSSYAAPIVSSYAASPVVYSPPLARIGAVAVQSPVLTSAYGIHPY